MRGNWAHSRRAITGPTPGQPLMLSLASPERALNSGTRRGCTPIFLSAEYFLRPVGPVGPCSLAGCRSPALFPVSAACESRSRSSLTMMVRVR